MPRVALNKVEYQISDFKHYINNRIQDRGTTQTKVASEIYMTQANLSQKLNKGTIKVSELFTLVDYLDIPGRDLIKLLGAKND